MAADDDAARKGNDENVGQSTSIETPANDIKVERNPSIETSSTVSAEKAELAEVPQQPLAQDTKVDIENDLAHLPENQQEILRRQLVIPEVKTSFFSCFRYASRSDKIIIVISAAASIGAGAALPLMTIVYGGLTNTMKDYQLGFTTKAEFTSKLDSLTLYFVYLAIGTFVLTYIQTVGFIYTGEHITQRIREQYLQAILRQNIAIFDSLGSGEITTKITSDTALIQDGISEKVGLTLSSITTFVTAFIIGFVRSWKLALILSVSVVAMVLGMGATGGYIQKTNVQSNQAYSAGGTIAEEAFSAIRTTVAFGKQKDLARKYAVSLTEGKKWGVKSRIGTGLMVAWMFFVMWAAYALAFWQGARFYLSGEIPLSAVITVLMASIIGAFSLGFVAPNIPAFGKAAASVSHIYKIIERTSPIDPTDDAGDKLDHVAGEIELRHIDHVYPSRPKVQVLHDVSLVIPAGKITALVGASGCGKSTIVGLVERFYDPIGGEVLLDGVNVQTLNLKWLRQNIKLVSQEPDLFSDSIFRNVAFGLFGTEHENASDEKKMELVRYACEMANIHSFIESLPEGYNTNVGERGFLMSGGQKQRIAIARAIVSNPKILLLDEATSALDTTSEGVVQRALDAASRGRTTITIAHRLSTIKNADNIVVLAKGRIVEQGTHDELIDKHGAYYSLVEAQKLARIEENTEGLEGESSEDSPIVRTITKKSLLAEDPNDEKPGLFRTETGKSKSSMALEGKKGEPLKNHSIWQLGKFTLSFNRKEIRSGFIVLGILASAVAGISQPVQGILFAKSVMSLSLPPDQKRRMKHDANLYALLYFVLALSVFIAYIVNGATLGISAERLIERARKVAIANLLRQDISFFDKEENATGALVTFLSTQTYDLAGISGITLGTIMQAATCIIAAFVVGLSFGWKLALVCMACIPLVIGCGFLRFHMLARFQQRARKSYEKSANYACEATNSIRTVASLTREQDVLDTYHGFMRTQKKKSIKQIASASTLYAASQSLTFLVFALAFWYGGRLIADREYDVFKFFVVITSVIFGAQSAGTVFSFAPDMGKAKQAAQELKHLVDSVPSIDTWVQSGEEKFSVEGSIEFRDVHFRYPTRPDVPVLRGLNLTVKPGQYVAICGASGCGKSTIIGLLERFYDPLHGGIYVDGKEISTLNVNDYREKLALVGQEPMLYSGSVGENILMGTTRDQLPEGEFPEVGQGEIWNDVERVAKDANIHEFITSLPQGYSTLCGTKSSLLSGGQKQRIALARALIRNPRILLLDEATSALDSHSEKIVQAALDKAAKGRTTIAVAHRLSTIQNADVIYVIHEGKVAEYGTHRELVEMKGRYWELVRLQSLEKHA